MSGPWEREDAKNTEIQCRGCQGYFPKASMTAVPMFGHGLCWYCDRCRRRAAIRISRRSIPMFAVSVVAILILAFVIGALHDHKISF